MLVERACLLWALRVRTRVTQKHGRLVVQRLLPGTRGREKQHTIMTHYHLTSRHEAVRAAIAINNIGCALLESGRYESQRTRLSRTRPGPPSCLWETPTPMSLARRWLRSSPPPTGDLRSRARR
jgi:hypothetical protein